MIETICNTYVVSFLAVFSGLAFYFALTLHDQ